jgi:hypothetical protein
MILLEIQVRRQESFSPKLKNFLNRFGKNLPEQVKIQPKIHSTKHSLRFGIFIK